MNSKFVIIGLIFSLLWVSGCINGKNTTINNNDVVTTTPPEPTNSDVTCAEGSTCALGPDEIRVEVYHFHRTLQCWSCKTLGSLAEKTVNTHFKDDLDSGKLTFGHINVEQAQNSDLANKYGASASSLMIGTYANGKFNKEEDTKVWYKLNNEEDYLSYLKGILEKRLRGDLS